MFFSDVDQMSDLSENADMENLSDEESSFYEQTSAEISHIAKKSRKHRIRTLNPAHGEVYSIQHYMIN